MFLVNCSDEIDFFTKVFMKQVFVQDLEALLVILRTLPILKQLKFYLKAQQNGVKFSFNDIKWGMDLAVNMNVIYVKLILMVQSL